MMIVGTFSPEIEIWNLDSENCEPVAVLGEAQDPKAKVKNFKKKKTLVAIDFPPNEKERSEN